MTLKSQEKSIELDVKSFLDFERPSYYLHGYLLGFKRSCSSSAYEFIRGLVIKYADKYRIYYDIDL